MTDLLSTCPPPWTVDVSTYPSQSEPEPSSRQVRLDTRSRLPMARRSHEVKTTVKPFSIIPTTNALHVATSLLFLLYLTVVSWSIYTRRICLTVLVYSALTCWPWDRRSIRQTWTAGLERLAQRGGVLFRCPLSPFWLLVSCRNRNGE